jgi:hypothetical protein
MHFAIFLFLDLCNILALYDLFDLELRVEVGCQTPAWATTTWFFVACGIQIVFCVDSSPVGRFRRAAFVNCFIMGVAQRMGILRVCEASVWTVSVCISIVILGASIGRHSRPVPIVTLLPAAQPSTACRRINHTRNSIKF